MDITYVKAVFGSLRKTRTQAVYRDDHDLILQLVGVKGLPVYFQAHFSNTEYGTAVVMMGSDGEVSIPNTLLATGLPIYCWILVEQGISGAVRYSVQIPVRQKARPDGTIPSEQADIISQAINTLNQAGDSAQQSASDAQGYAERAEAAQSASETAAAESQQNATTASQKAQEAAQSATDADESEAKAKRYAQDAEVDANRAEMAAKNAGYFDVEVDARGRLIYKRTDQVNTDLSMDTNGHLIVEIA